VGAFVIGVIALYPFLRRARVPKTGAGTLATVGGVAALALLMLVGCDRSAAPAIAYGRADCDVCLMRIVDNRFGGLAITAKGKTKEFDSIECLATFASSVTGLRSTWVSDFDHPGTLVEATRAWFVRKGGAASEMGANLLAFSASADTSAIRARFGVSALAWPEVQSLAKRNALRSVAAVDEHDAH
jgi:copper chaperone NosL